MIFRKEGNRMATDFDKTNNDLVKMATDCEFLQYVDKEMGTEVKEYQKACTEADTATTKLNEVNEKLNAFPNMKIPSEKDTEAWDTFKTAHPEFAKALLLYKESYDAYIKASAHKNFCMKKMEMLQDTYERFQANK